jgi:hypothetical protein
MKEMVLVFTSPWKQMEMPPGTPTAVVGSKEPDH